MSVSKRPSTRTMPVPSTDRRLPTMRLSVGAPLVIQCSFSGPWPGPKFVWSRHSRRSAMPKLIGDKEVPLAVGQLSVLMLGGFAECGTGAIFVVGRSDDLRDVGVV